MSAQLSQLFILNLYPRGTSNFTIFTPEPIEPMVVKSAWSYAIRYTAKGLDLPDHEAAVKMMIQRHPSWKIIQSTSVIIPIDLTIADEDKPETPQK